MSNVVQFLTLASELKNVDFSTVLEIRCKPQQVREREMHALLTAINRVAPIAVATMAMSKAELVAMVRTNTGVASWQKPFATAVENALTLATLINLARSRLKDALATVADDQQDDDRGRRGGRVAGKCQKSSSDEPTTAQRARDGRAPPR